MFLYADFYARSFVFRPDYGFIYQKYGIIKCWFLGLKNRKYCIVNQLYNCIYRTCFSV